MGLPSIDEVRATTRTCGFHLNRIIRARFHDGAEVTLEDAQANLAATAKLAGGRPLPVMVDLRGVRSQSAEARAYFAGPQALAVCTAVALVIGSPLSRMIGNFFLGFNRPPMPTRLFTKEEDAAVWLERFLVEP